jgi:polyphosphate:AMP phosphotransferase
MPLLAEAASKHPDQEILEQETDRIRRFESMLTANNVQIIKLWYHLSAKAQAARTKHLLSSPETSWQVSPADRKVAKNFDRLRQGGKTVLTLTDAAHAPWFVIPSADEDLRTVRTAETVLAAMHRHTSPIPATAHIPQQRPKQRRVPDRLGKLDYTSRLDQDTYDTERALLQGRLARASRSPKFRRKHTLVLVFEGQDAAGKGGAIRRVTRALDARQYQITPVAAPVSYERARPYLWRFWKELPRRGRIVIFDRSWYGRVLVERVENIIHPADWHRAYGEINHFEQQLVESGAIVLKFWMAITSEVQLKRFHEREFSPYKNFKLTPEDWRNRKRWDDYAQAANEMFAHTDTPDAPWLVIPANNKHYARVQVLKHIVDAVETRL